jgi:hypothetical protein
MFDNSDDEEEEPKMLGVTYEKDVDQDPRNFTPGGNNKRMLPAVVEADEDAGSGDHFEMTTTTMVSQQTAMQTTTVTTRRVAELEEQVRELAEELQFALANPGAYKQATMEVQLKSAQDSSTKLSAENERLKKLNKIQQQTMFELAAEHQERRVVVVNTLRL